MKNYKTEKCCRNCEYAYLHCKGCDTTGDNKYQNFKLRKELAENQRIKGARDLFHAALILASKELAQVYGECPYSNKDLEMPKWCDIDCFPNEKGQFLCWDRYLLAKAKQILEKIEKNS